MATGYRQRGGRLTYTNTGAAISAGDAVVVGNMVCVALVDIAATTGVGELGTTEVWELAKVSAAVILQGEHVSWDVSAAAVDDTAFTGAAGDLLNFGVAWEAAGAAVLLIDVLLLPGNATIV